MDPREYDQALLQAYRARLPPKRASDAEFLDNNVYASDPVPQPPAPPFPGAAPPPQPPENKPRGLVDRLYRERFKGQPMISNPVQRIPSTKNGYV